MPKATVIGKADEGNLQVRLDEGSGSRRNKDPKGQPESQRSRILRACSICSTSTLHFEVPYKQISPITDEEWDKGSWSFSKLLVFQEPLLKKIPRAIVINYQDWRVTFFTAFSHPVVSSLLLVGLMIGFYIQINIRRFGIPGWIAAGCLALILLSSFMSYAINWIEVLILGAGLILLILELFVIPGFGIIGILGFVLTIIALLALMLPGVGELNFLNLNSVRLISGAFIGRLAWLLGGLLFSTAAIVLMSHFFFLPSLFFFKIGAPKRAKEGQGTSSKRDAEGGLLWKVDYPSLSLWESPYW